MPPFLPAPLPRLVSSIALLTGLACGQETSAPSPKPPPLGSAQIRLTPVVARPGEPFTLSLRVAGAQGPTIIATPTDAPGGAPRTMLLQQSGRSVESLILYDDGSHGDAQSGDGWYTTTGLTLPVGPTGIAVEMISSLTVGQPASPLDSIFLSLRIGFRAMDPARIPIPAVISLATNARATSRVVSLAMPPVREPTQATLDVVLERYFELLPDDRDFLVVEFPPSAATATDAWWAQSLVMRNNIPGIGLPIRQFRSFSSRARLQVAVLVAAMAYNTLGPPGGFCLLNHELAHRWMAYTNDRLSVSGHWIYDRVNRPTSVLGDSLGCLMNDLELYLAGFLPADSITTPLTSDGYALADVIQVLGPRGYGPGEAERKFTIGFIVVDATTLADEELAFFHHVATEYVAAESDLGRTWFVATGGRSTLDGILPTSLGVALAGRNSRASRTAPRPGRRLHAEPDRHR